MATAGTGKNFITQALAGSVRVQSCGILLSASSGLAALHLPGGLTIHSNYGVPVPCWPDSNVGVY